MRPSGISPVLVGGFPRCLGRLRGQSTPYDSAQHLAYLMSAGRCLEGVSVIPRPISTWEALLVSDISRAAMESRIEQRVGAEIGGHARQREH